MNQNDIRRTVHQFKRTLNYICALGPEAEGDMWIVQGQVKDVKDFIHTGQFSMGIDPHVLELRVDPETIPPVPDDFPVPMKARSHLRPEFHGTFREALGADRADHGSHGAAERPRSAFSQIHKGKCHDICEFSLQQGQGESGLFADPAVFTADQRLHTGLYCAFHCIDSRGNNRALIYSMFPFPSFP